MRQTNLALVASHCLPRLPKILHAIGLILLILAGSASSSLLAAPISGTITLPDTAPVGGVQFFYQARDISAEGEPSQSGFTTIPEGGSSLNYSLPNVPANPDATWVISYTCGFTASCLDYVENGYFQAGVAGTTTFNQLAATPVSQGSSGINMQVLSGTQFSGSMTLPSGVAPAEGVDFKIFIFDGSLTRNEDFTIEPGESSVEFRMKMPNNVNLDYIVRYSCPTLGAVSSYCFDNFIRNGFFKMNATGNAVASTSDADHLPAETTRNDLDMEFLTGSTISGRVSLPSGVAPPGGVTVRVRATDTVGGNLNSFRSVTIPMNATFADYALSVADDAMASWRISLGCDADEPANNCDDYFRSVFYDADDPVDTTTDRLSDASALTGGTNHTNINMSLLSTLMISGVIRIEDPLFAPAGGLTLTVSAQDNIGGGVAVFEDAVIAVGQTSIAYSLTIPNTPDTNWSLSYSCKDPSIQTQCDAFERFGYYDSDAPGTTTNNSNEEESLDGGVNHFKKDLTVFARPEVEQDEESICFPVMANNGKVTVVCL